MNHYNYMGQISGALNTTNNQALNNTSMSEYFKVFL